MAGRLDSTVRRQVKRIFDTADSRRALAEATSAGTKVALRSLMLEYATLARSQALPPVWQTGFRVFSQFDEDGVIAFLLAVIGAGSGRFVDIGAGNAVLASNCANLALNLGFDGLFVEADDHALAWGRNFYASHPDTRERPPAFATSFVTRENVNDVIARAGFSGEIDVLSIDVDGNDLWIWDAIEVVEPRIVIIEIHTELGLEDWSMPYDPHFDWRALEPGARIGASAVAMTRLAEQRGYRLVGSNLYGFNPVYLRSDLGDGLLPSIEVSELFRHGSYRRDPAAPAT